MRTRLFVSVAASVIAVVLFLQTAWMGGASPVRHNRIPDVVSALAAASTVHFAGWYTDLSGRKRPIEGWAKGGRKLRLREPGIEVFYDGTRYVEVHRHSFPHLTLREAARLSFYKNGMSFLPMLAGSGFRASWTAHQGEESYRSFPAKLDNGRTGRLMEIVCPCSCLKLTVDAASLLPVRWVERDFDGTITGSTEMFEYRVDRPDTFFQPTEIEGMPVFDLRTPESSRRSTERVAKQLMTDPQIRLVLRIPAGSTGRVREGGGFIVETVGPRGCMVFHLADRNVIRIVGKAFVRTLGKDDGRMVEDADIKCAAKIG